MATCKPGHPSVDQAEPVRWASVVPLIGGIALGCQAVTGNFPLFHASFSVFSSNEAHLRTYWPTVPIIYLDKEEFPHDRFLAHGEIDFVASVCPCAGLSMLNRVTGGEKGRGSDASQNEWMIKSAKFVLQIIKPKAYWGENAPGLFSDLGRGIVNRLRDLALEHGYSFSMVKTNSQLHGLPQMRIRTFYFFWRSATVPMLRHIVKQAPHLIEYLREIPPWATFQDQFAVEGKVTERFKPYLFVLSRENMTHQEFAKTMAERFGTITISRYLEKYGLVDDCIKWLKEYFPNDKWSVKNNSKSRTHIQYLTHMKDKLSRGLGYWDDSPKFMGGHFTSVITKNVLHGVHPVEDRFLNIREIMHLMGLPHDFQIDDPKNWNHVCQNVPLNTASDWAAEVVRFCRGEGDMTNFSFLKQDNCINQVVESEMYEAPDLFSQHVDYMCFLCKKFRSQTKTEANLHIMICDAPVQKASVNGPDTSKLFECVVCDFRAHEEKLLHAHFLDRGAVCAKTYRDKASNKTSPVL